MLYRFTSGTLLDQGSEALMEAVCPESCHQNSGTCTNRTVEELSRDH